jgi:hypothetical protein
MVFLTKPNGYQEMCDTNKNVTKMDMIMKGVYYIYIYIYYTCKVDGRPQMRSSFKQYLSSIAYAIGQVCTCYFSTIFSLQNRFFII